MDKSVRIAIIIIALGIALSLFVGVSIWGITVLSSTIGIAAVHSIIAEVMYFALVGLICVGSYMLFRKVIIQ